MTTAKELLDALPDDRRKALAKVRSVIRKNLPKGYQEQVEGNFIHYVVPLKRYPNTYNGKPLQFVSLASQSRHMAIYMMCTYGDEAHRAWFEKAYADAGKKLDAGKACVRFKRLEDLPLEVIGEAVARVSVDDYLAVYERARAGTKTGKRQAKRAAQKK